MKSKNAREYLESLYNAEMYVQQQREIIENLKEDAASLSGIAYDSERVQTNGSRDIMARRVTQYLDAEAPLADYIRQLIYKRHDMIDQIQSLENWDHAVLLFKRYIEYKDFQSISIEMGISYDHARRMHGQALSEFEALYME